jgi:bis(5'-nucleosidyl)-tetraphosphatase
LPNNAEDGAGIEIRHYCCMPARSKATPSPTLSAGVVVVRLSAEGWRVLLLRAYNYWDCPKGLVEPGEDSLTAAKREVREETSITDLEFRWGEDFIETEPYSKNKVARYYLAATAMAEVKLPVNPELGAPEHHEYRWLNFEAAKALAVPRIAAVLEWARKSIDQRTE